MKIIAIILIVLGVLSLGYTSISYTKKTDEVNLGPIEVSINEKSTISIPLWAGIGAIAVGGGILLAF
ncbi:MAG: hypothetical protein RBR59_04080 [Sulfurimonadaceae bacterium]|jgi:hypothetical protein|nr:hypothetical protein [Sulfurimonadaceae bacterium]